MDWHKPDELITQNFSVGEVTQGDPRRIPEPGPEEDNILRMAEELEKIRKAWGSGIGVTSWYRPYWVNLEVGGVSDSQHISGGAVDIYPLEGSGLDFENWLDQRWGGALGYGQASGRGFTHIDLREGGFLDGPGEIRWQY